VGLWSESNHVAILASALAYLGAGAGLVVAMLMALTIFMGVPGRPTTVTRKVVAIAQVLGDTTMTTNPKSRVTSAISRRDARSARGIRRTHGAAATPRGQSLHMLDRQERPKRLADQQKANFETRYLGYVDNPSADLSPIR
jgi:hypothetical protein